MVDRIRWDTVSYLPFYYVFFQFLLLTIFNLQANILTTKDILSNLDCFYLDSHYFSNNYCILPFFHPPPPSSTFSRCSSPTEHLRASSTPWAKFLHPPTLCGHRTGWRNHLSQRSPKTMTNQFLVSPQLDTMSLEDD